MKIGIGNDHSAVEYKNIISKYIQDKYGYEVVNYGTDTSDSCNYAIYGEKLAKAVVNKEVDLAIAICGTGIGISLACNKVNGIRCGVCSEAKSAMLSRLHNNANIIAFGARIIDIEKAKEIVDAFLTTEFEGGRHLERIDYLTKIEEKNR